MYILFYTKNTIMKTKILLFFDKALRIITILIISFFFAVACCLVGGLIEERQWMIAIADVTFVLIIWALFKIGSRRPILATDFGPFAILSLSLLVVLVFIILGTFGGAPWNILVFPLLLFLCFCLAISKFMKKRSKSWPFSLYRNLFFFFTIKLKCYSFSYFCYYKVSFL